jgi:hypothetical protein
MVLPKILSKAVLGLPFCFLVFLIFPPFMALAHSGPMVERVDAEVLADVVRVVEEIDAMRSALATTIDPREMEVDEETFAMVCRPVGMRAKRIAEEKGWEFRQLAIKYRNPKNKAGLQAVKAMEKFARESELQGFWTIDSSSGKDGFRYFRRITVEPACLNCHGEKEKRPDFIKNKYPDDRAFDFNSGDLRGVYSINFQSQN